ncbi:MAG TPA: hypothetical protein VG479_11130 [Gaiellaceae bacterium]|jgi:hypothetical protein|nr:hypothetical protein [Gaiellaceae bacterium]
MRDDRDLFRLHPVSILGSLAGGRPDEGPARVDAEPDFEPERPRALRRLVQALGRRRSTATPQTERI